MFGLALLVRRSIVGTAQHSSAQISVVELVMEKHSAPLGLTPNEVISILKEWG